MKNFHYVEHYDEDGKVHHLIRKGDPIRGEIHGEYSSAATALYKERLLNAHQSHHYALDEFEHMYQSEIDFLLVGMWDGGIEWALGNGPNIEAMFDDATAKGLRGNKPTLEEALVEMTNAARRAFPDSEFARPRPTDISLRVTPTLHELMWRAMKEVPGFVLTHTPSSDPYEPFWVCESPNGEFAYGGYTPEEAIAELLSNEGTP